MRISVVIATKDRARYLERVFASLEAQIAAPSFELVVADNGSSDGTRDEVELASARVHFPIRYVSEPQPNRAKARNRGIEAAEGYLVLFCDDDVQLPPGFLAAHEAAHARDDVIVDGPIINVPSYDFRPKPTLANYSGAFLCSCNASLPKRAFVAAGGFDERFNLYGWEDTELGVRLRRSGLKRKFAWDAYLWHIKLPGENTLEVETRKAMEKARMARSFVEKHPGLRARFATGAYGLNLLRGKYLLPDAMLSVLAGIATSDNVPGIVRTLARTQFLDGMYTRELSDHAGTGGAKGHS
jgi:glycosyltransferase involved in cell wall biosynthesis